MTKQELEQRYKEGEVMKFKVFNSECKINKCLFCEKVNEAVKNKHYSMLLKCSKNNWTSLNIIYHRKNNIEIGAIGDDSVYFAIKYCPKCGKKLKEIINIEN